MNVYDFDETIYNGESSLEFVLFFVRKDKSILKFIPKVLKAFVLYEKGRLTLDAFMNEYGVLLADYCRKTNVNIQAVAEEFWQTHQHKINSFYLNGRREDDIIVTASPRFMMEYICKRLSVKNLVCTEFDIKTGTLHKACYRENKVPMLFEAFPDVEIDEFYTDSMNDEFLFPYSKKVFLVKKGAVSEFHSPAVGSKLKENNK